jgi:hypothetical protein
MKRARDPWRRILATAVTCAVVLLLGIAQLSIGLTDDYYFDRGPASTDDDTAVWSDRSLADLGDRIRVQLGSTTRTTPPHEISVMTHDSHGVRHVDTMVSSPPDETRQIFEVLASALFAFFGLFVLWWGRDRASLWLGIFCAAFGTAMVQFFGLLPPVGMLAAALVDVVFEALAIYALYALAETVALDTLAPDDPIRTVLHGSRMVAVATVVVVALTSLISDLMPTLRREPMPDALAMIGVKATLLAVVGVLTLAPLAFLTLGALRAKDQPHRNRALVILATTACALSGVVYSLVKQLPAGQAGFDSPWFSLLAIPAGFIITIPAYRVVEVKIVVNRLLVLAGMTLIIGVLITQSELWVHGAAINVIEPALDPNGTRHDLIGGAIGWAIDFAIACAIVLSFGTVHQLLDGTFKRMVFRRRDEGIAALHDFSVHRASFVTARRALIEQTAGLVKESVGAHGAAIYEECSGGYERTASSGTWPWPPLADVDDPAFVALRSEAELLELDGMLALESALGNEGVALRMVVGGRLTGALCVAPRANEGDGPYVRAELDALDDIARSVADALFTLRSAETAAFVRAVADGQLAGVEARRRAEALCDCATPEPPRAGVLPPAGALPLTAGASPTPGRTETVRPA